MSNWIQMLSSSCDGLVGVDRYVYSKVVGSLLAGGMWYGMQTYDKLIDFSEFKRNDKEGDVSVKDAHAMGPFFLVSDISGREFYTRIFLQKKV